MQDFCRARLAAPIVEVHQKRLTKPLGGGVIAHQCAKSLLGESSRTSGVAAQYDSELNITMARHAAAHVTAQTCNSFGVACLLMGLSETFAPSTHLAHPDDKVLQRSLTQALELILGRRMRPGQPRPRRGGADHQRHPRRCARGNGQRVRCRTHICFSRQRRKD